MTTNADIAEPVIVLDDDQLIGADTLEPHGDYDGVLLDAIDLTGHRPRDVRITRSRLRRCMLDGADLSAALLAECELDRIEAASLDLVGATMRDVEVSSSRIGGLRAYDADVTRMVVRGCRLGYVNLRGATLVDVVFDKCSIGDLDVGDATLQRVRLSACTIERLSCPHATMTDVDLTGVDVGSVSDPAQLRGATISTAQLAVFAPELAAHLGIEVVSAPGTVAR
jgi:uncharacterized protein YjbI with pentapeptide repeats